MERLLFALTFLAALGAGLMAGLFFAFSVSVMAALGRLPPAGGISAMQSINVVVLNPLFFAVFFGTAAAALALAIAALIGWSNASAPYLLAGSLLYLVGTILVTIAFNVPLNNRLASVTPGSSEGAAPCGRGICRPGPPGIMYGRPRPLPRPLHSSWRLSNGIGDPIRRTHMAYVDGFIVPVPKKSLAAYQRMARKAGKIWREHGALEFRECVGDDLKIKGVAPFPRAARVKPGETVVFSWIAFKSRAHRDRVNAKVMEDPRLHKMIPPKGMPFDGKRMFWGGFKTLVDL